MPAKRSAARITFDSAICAVWSAGADSTEETHALVTLAGAADALACESAAIRQTNRQATCDAFDRATEPDVCDDNCVQDACKRLRAAMGTPRESLRRDDLLAWIEEARR